MAQLCRAISSQLRHVSTIGKKNLLRSNISPTCPYNMVNFGPLAAEIISLVWSTPANFNGFRVLAALLHIQTAALNRGHHLYSTGRPSRWALAHISSLIFFLYCKSLGAYQCWSAVWSGDVSVVAVAEAAARDELSPLQNQLLTKFSQEVVELLQHSPQCSLLFNRFIPTYHRHFGRQCRISNYGVTRLIELFDAIPHVVQVCVRSCIWCWC